MVHFYKYLTPLAARAVLTNRTLRWTTPPTLNDPFDMQFAFQFLVDRDPTCELALEKQWSHYKGETRDLPLNALGQAIRKVRMILPHVSRPEFDAKNKPTIEESFDKFVETLPQLSADLKSAVVNDKIFCVSAIPDSILMWSYYAQNHSGLVLRFNSEIDESPLSEARAVDYVDEVPSVVEAEHLSDMLSGYGDIGPRELLDLVVFTKYRDWAHEKEWRVYSGAGRTANEFEDVKFNGAELGRVLN